MEHIERLTMPPPPITSERRLPLRQPPPSFPTVLPLQYTNPARNGWVLLHLGRDKILSHRRACSTTKNLRHCPRGHPGEVHTEQEAKYPAEADDCGLLNIQYVSISRKSLRGTRSAQL